MAMSAAVSQGVGAHNVFVYGSLLADEVVQVLLKRIPSSSPAILPGYHRFSIKGRVYPAILPVENKKVAGRVLMGITNPELDILDIFEDVEYVRDSVEVSLERDKMMSHFRAFSGAESYSELSWFSVYSMIGSHRTEMFASALAPEVRMMDSVLQDNLEKLQTYTYVWDDKNDPDLYGEWDFEEWKEEHMIDFIKMTEEFVEELEQPESKSRVATYNSYYQSNDNPSAA
ncbi:hypothetical protein Cgig2_011361 [Carnegiea gigantea]|uniref:Putative gamma-glutamylcyclotransferase n=1 Tax=Carnegiea gigantea TaxID=171969 RepID=A0A9Q1QQL6_9CARY|nr:hypothetical protein Cgig2_011361 [Carnegiea gigantea]